MRRKNKKIVPSLSAATSSGMKSDLSSSKSKRKMGSKWPDLPGDLLRRIAEMTSFTNMQYVHLRTVCKGWRQTLTPHPDHLPPHVPWLMLPRLPKNICPTGVSDSHVSFYDLARSKTHQLELTYMSGKYTCGSSHGWLVLEHQHRMSLFNPITRISINLPSLDSPPTLLTLAKSKTKRSNYHWEYTSCVLKASLSCSPSKAGCVVVVWIASSNWDFGFCQIGDTNWTRLERIYGRPKLVDFTFHNNLVYTVDIDGGMSVHDLRDLSMRTFPSLKKFKCRVRDGISLVEGDANSGGPFLVRTSEHLGKQKVVVHKWCDDSQHWLLVKDIEEHAFFLNERHAINLQWDEKRGSAVYYDIRHSLTIATFCVGINGLVVHSGREVLWPRLAQAFHILSSLPMWVTPSLI